MQLLEGRYREDIEPNDYVSPNTKDARKGNLHLMRAFHVALRKSGVQNFRFHDLRHTFATRLVQAGGDLYTVQKLRRWKTVSMVQRYAHHNTCDLTLELREEIRGFLGGHLLRLCGISRDMPGYYEISSDRICFGMGFF